MICLITNNKGASSFHSEMLPGNQWIMQYHGICVSEVLKLFYMKVFCFLQMHLQNFPFFHRIFLLLLVVIPFNGKEISCEEQTCVKNLSDMWSVVTLVSSLSREEGRADLCGKIIVFMTVPLPSLQETSQSLKKLPRESKTRHSQAELLKIFFLTSSTKGKTLISCTPFASGVD